MHHVCCIARINYSVYFIYILIYCIFQYCFIFKIYFVLFIFSILFLRLHSHTREKGVLEGFVSNSTELVILEFVKPKNPSMAGTECNTECRIE